MNAKLTLSLNKEIIERAKNYASEHNMSLSFLVENFLLKITSDFSGKKTDNQGSIVKELSGIIKLEDVNPVEDHIKYLEEKYQ